MNEPLLRIGALVSSERAPRRSTSDPTRAPRSESRLPSEAVLVVPGFLGSDLTTAPLRSMLRSAGLNALPWTLGANLGPVEGLMQQLLRRVRDLAEASASPLTFVGHSLGGVYAREIAKVAPDLVRQVITLGSPIRTLEPGNPFANTSIVRLIERTSGRSVQDLQREGWFCDIAAPLPMRCIAFYSKRDRVAPWQTCLQWPSALAENVEVDTTHLRMIVSPAVSRLIVERASVTDPLANAALLSA